MEAMQGIQLMSDRANSKVLKCIDTDRAISKGLPHSEKSISIVRCQYVQYVDQATTTSSNGSKASNRKMIFLQNRCRMHLARQFRCKVIFFSLAADVSANRSKWIPYRNSNFRMRKSIWCADIDKGSMFARMINVETSSRNWWLYISEQIRSTCVKKSSARFQPKQIAFVYSFHIVIVCWCEIELRTLAPFASDKMNINANDNGKSRLL